MLLQVGLMIVSAAPPDFRLKYNGIDFDAGYAVVDERRSKKFWKPGRVFMSKSPHAFITLSLRLE